MKDRFFDPLTICLAIALMFLVFLSAKSCRAEVVSVAQSQIGLGEVGGNNKGIYVRKYLNGRENLPWCAGFVSYCLKKDGYNIPYLLRAKSFLDYGQKVNNPKAGDLIVFSRQGGGHVGIVEKVAKETITTIEGNTGDYPSKVKRITYKRNHIKNFLAFVRLYAKLQREG
jgi:uncharacterized protein (TIGR02594 family)